MPSTVGDWKFLFYGGPLSLEGLVYFCLGLKIDLVRTVEWICLNKRSVRICVMLALVCGVVMLALRIGLPARFCQALRPFIIVPLLFLLLKYIPKRLMRPSVVKSSFVLFSTHYFVVTLMKDCDYNGSLVVMTCSIVVGIVIASLLRKLPKLLVAVFVGGRV